MNMKRDIKRLKDEAALARHIVSELATAVMKLSEMVMEIANSAVPIEPEKKADRFVTGTTAAADLKKELEEAARVMDGLLKDKPNYAPGDRVRIKRPGLEGIEGVVVTAGLNCALVEVLDDRGGRALCAWDEMEPVDKEKTGKVFVTGTTSGRFKSDEPNLSVEELKSDTVSKRFKAGDRVRITGGRFKGQTGMVWFSQSLPGWVEVQLDAGIRAAVTVGWVEKIEELRKGDRVLVVSSGRHMNDEGKVDLVLGNKAKKRYRVKFKTGTRPMLFRREDLVKRT